ncbi:MAG: 4Fe-4S binding protein [Hyphomicrobiaceae bacterium]|jgi:ferredoxin
MTANEKTVILCSCEGTMTLDPERVGAACGAKVVTARHLCRSERGMFQRVAAAGGKVVVACTQEAPLFEELSEDGALPAELSFVNVRETAGWSREGAKAAPKMAALLAAAAEAGPPPSGVTFESAGVTLIYGRDQTAIDAGLQLKDRLDITVVIDGSADLVPPRQMTFPIRRGRIVKAAGHLGAFELTIDGLAEPEASSRAKLTFGAGRDGAVSNADLLIDLSGGPALFGAPDLRDGYLRGDPGNAAEVQRLLFKAADLVGSFDKPRYITFREDLCAHARSRKIGCRRCLDLCPAGAISPAGNTVAIDANLCGGCGACAAICPTGAAAYAVPAADVLLRRLRALLATYRTAGGRDPVVLFHDDRHGGDLIDALARFGEGLPAHVLPVAVNEVTQVGLEAIAACFAYGARAVRFLNRAKPQHDSESLLRTLSYAEPLLTALGYGRDLAAIIGTDDPDELAAQLSAVPLGIAAPRPATFLAMGGKREVLNLALRELHRSAPQPVDTVAMPAGAPFGRIKVDVAGCTLCLSCVSACPTRALGDAEDRPLLRFDESLCVQCGLCQATCPERVISLESRLDFAAFERGSLTIKEEEPFCCITCGKAFGVKSTVERIVAKLQEKHWMFTGENARRLDLVKMCDTCRIEKVTTEGVDPYAGPARPLLRTTDDYFRDREKQMLDKIDKGEA